MTQPVIDTLRLADRLKESGFQDPQAEGLARALGTEFNDHVITKPDLEGATQVVRADYRALDTKIDAVDGKSEARIGALDEKFEARINALGTQLKFIFAVLAALLALGLFDTVTRLIA